MAWQKQKSIQAGGGRFVDGYLAYLLAQASQRISAEFHLQVRAAGLSVTEWRVLASLEGSAGETIGTLAVLAITKQPTLSKVVQRMEADGLVERTGVRADRRQTRVHHHQGPQSDRGPVRAGLAASEGRAGAVRRRAGDVADRDAGSVDDRARAAGDGRRGRGLSVPTTAEFRIPGISRVASSVERCLLRLFCYEHMRPCFEAL